MNANNTKAIELWTDTWPAKTHKTEYAAKRIKSAQSAKLTPVKIDYDDMYGYFQGGHGRYETFLDYCPCGDFIRSKLPCKHIYRLAIELKVLNISVDSNVNAIPTPKGEHVDLDKTINIVEGLSENAQRELLKVSSGLNSSNPTCKTDFNRNIKELLESGIIVESEPVEHIIKFGKKSEIIEFLDKENIPYDKKNKKDELIELCEKYASKKAEEIYGYIVCVSIPTQFSAQNIHNYLHRKYDTDYVFDLKKGYKEVPLLKTDLPADKITEQLIIHGHYSSSPEQLPPKHTPFL